MQIGYMMRFLIIMGMETVVSGYLVWRYSVFN
nr:MAG TPA: hypothetical protein [Caudoviricetes sp.]